MKRATAKLVILIKKLRENTTTTIEIEIGKKNINIGFLNISRK